MNTINAINRAKYSRMDQVKFVEDSLLSEKKVMFFQSFIDLLHIGFYQKLICYFSVFIYLTLYYYI